MLQVLWDPPSYPFITSFEFLVLGEMLLFMLYEIPLLFTSTWIPFHIQRKIGIEDINLKNSTQYIDLDNPYVFF